MQILTAKKRGRGEMSVQSFTDIADWSSTIPFWGLPIYILRAEIAYPKNLFGLFLTSKGYLIFRVV